MFVIAQNGLPALEEYASKVGNEHFKGVQILYINHLISDAMMVALAMKEAGADVRTVGIPYGSLDSDERRWVIEEYKKIGPLEYPIVENCLTFRQKMRECVLESLREIDPHGKPLMIVEDGGYAFPVLHEPGQEDLLDLCVGAVEHTARGMWNYQYMEVDQAPQTPRLLQRPAITIANSKLKNAHEPIFVAQAIVHDLVSLLKKEHEFLPFRNVAVLGNGRIGRPIAELIAKMGANVETIDPRPADLAEGRTVHLMLTPEIFSHSSIFVGASGTPAVSREQLLNFLAHDKNVAQKFFASASSKNIEFEEVIRVFDDMTANQELCERVFGESSSMAKENISEFGLRYTLTSNGTKRQFSVLAEGYPLIFYPRHSQGGPIKPFDPVMTQLFLAACALRSKYASLENRVHTLDEMRENFTHDEPLESLLDDRMLLRRWCELVDLNPDSYFRQIGYE